MRTQQAVLYAAERTVDWGHQFTGLPEVQEFLDELREAWWWGRNFSSVLRVEVFADRRLSRSDAFFHEDGVGEITFSTTTPTVHIVLHELAHVLARARYGSKAHDPWFARVLVELVYLVRGPEAYVALAEAFVRNDIDFDAPGVVDSNAIRA